MCLLLEYHSLYLKYHSASDSRAFAVVKDIFITTRVVAIGYIFIPSVVVLIARIKEIWMTEEWAGYRLTGVLLVGAWVWLFGWAIAGELRPQVLC